MKTITILAALALTGCAGYTKSFTLGIVHGETRVDATWQFTGKKVVPTK